MIFKLYEKQGSLHSNFREVQFEENRITKIVKKGEEGYYPEFNFNGKGFSTTYPNQREIEEIITSNFEILMPVTQYNWESYHSITNQAGHQTILSKELSLNLDLVNVPQSFNLYEKNGKLASLNFRFHEDFNTNQHFVYLRKDLFDSFLHKMGYKLVWGIWGEKQISFKDNPSTEQYTLKNDLDRIKPFKKIVPYTCEKS